MAINYNNAVAITNPLYLSKSEPLDLKTKIDALVDVNSILYPWVGMIFYVTSAAQHYKVNTLKQGYLVYATNTIVANQPAGTEYVNWEIVPNVLIGTYSILVTGGAGSTLVVANTPTEVNDSFNTQFPSATGGDWYVDKTKSKLFLKFSNTEWLGVNVNIFDDSLVIPTVLGANIEPFK